MTGASGNAPQLILQSDHQAKYDGSKTLGFHIVRYGFTFNRIAAGASAALQSLAPFLLTNVGASEEAFAHTGPFSGGDTNPLNYPVESVGHERIELRNRGELTIAAARFARIAQAVLERDYKINGRKSLEDVQTRWKLHLAPVFGELCAANVGNDDLTKYVDQRQKEGASNATINREMAVLKRAFSLGLESRKVHNAPHFPHLEERNVRKGIVEDTQYARIAAACSKRGLWLRAMFEVGYNFGWRVSELLKLRVRQVDLAARTIRLEADETKNEDARTVVMTGLVYALIQQRVFGKQADDYVFTRGKKPVRDFRDTWSKACAEAGVPGLLFHDLRRSAVRNMVRNGIPERVAMTISGHKTRSVFDRYNIVSESDLREAAAKLEKRDGERKSVQNGGHVESEYGHSSAIGEQFSGVVANVQKVN